MSLLFLSKCYVIINVLADQKQNALLPNVYLNVCDKYQTLLHVNSKPECALQVHGYISRGNQLRKCVKYEIKTNLY